MTSPTHFIGIDLADETFAVSVLTKPDQEIFTRDKFVNRITDFPELTQWLAHHRVDPASAVIVVESTGVYGEQLCHHLVKSGYRLAIEPPHLVKRAFPPIGHKTDPIDSRSLAIYGYRYLDELHFWQPNTEQVEHIRTLLTTREALVHQKTAHMCSIKAIRHKAVPTPQADQIHETMIQMFVAHIKAIDQQMKALAKHDPVLHQKVERMTGIPGVGMLLTLNLLVLTNGFTKPLNPKKLAAYIGLCPYEKQSGKSIRSKPCTQGFGPGRLRKLIYLAALSIRTHNPAFQKYFARKVAEGKPKRLVINNISNRLIKIICAVHNSNSPFIENYQSINPKFLKKGLTKS